MGIRNQVEFFNVVSGARYSEDVNISNIEKISVHFPLVTSGGVQIQGAFTNAASASYFPLSNPVSGSLFGAPSGALTLQIGIGSVCVNLTPYVEALTAFRIDLGVAQAQPVSLAILKKF